MGVWGYSVPAVRLGKSKYLDPQCGQQDWEQGSSQGSSLGTSLGNSLPADSCCRLPRSSVSPAVTHSIAMRAAAGGRCSCLRGISRGARLALCPRSLPCRGWVRGSRARIVPSAAPRRCEPPCWGCASTTPRCDNCTRCCWGCPPPSGLRAGFPAAP